MDNYDYIISGSGAAGMSLLYRMMRHPGFANKKILVVDRAIKNTNDHTWCFWEEERGVFESVVCHQWQNVHFYSNHFSGLLNLAPYQYKMIRSVDLYNLVMDEAAKHDNITFLYGKITSLVNEGNKALLIVDSMHITADYIFNSILVEPYTIPKGKHHLLQHFKGFVIATTAPVFKPDEATLMDFRVSQQHGTTFMYVLPVAANKALVEYTLFTKKLLQQEQYSTAIKAYIKDVLHITEYKVIEEEFGVIPMTNIYFVKQEGRVVNMGTAGGQTKPSTGYTFRFIQKQCDAIIVGLLNGKFLSKTTFNDKKFHLYDSVLLNVLANNRLPGDEVFTKMFQRNRAENVLKFLDNETNLRQDIGIISSFPVLPFLKAGFQEVFK